MQKVLCIKNDIHELCSLTQFLEEVGDELGLSPSLVMNLNLVLEEAVSNIIFYAYPQDAVVEEAVILTFTCEHGELSICLKDHGIAFDPTQKEDPDLTLSAEERPIGGLGIFLIRQLMDEVTYRREGDCNLFTMKKRITA